MDKRLELQTMLEKILESRNVYYQPPNSFKMNYPAIVYSRDSIDNEFADDKVYMQHNRYTITVIDSNPDSIIVKKISLLPGIMYDRNYKSDNLNHDVFKLYY